MITILLFVLAVAPLHLPVASEAISQETRAVDNDKSIINEMNAIEIIGQNYPISLKEIAQMLNSQQPQINPAVINKVLTTLGCAAAHNVAHNSILTVIDYSLPSSEKRLWVFDLQQKKLLFYTYVSHGIKSGTLFSQFFSNKFDSKASSIGVYRTDESYYGREGLSLRLSGLETSFNDNATNRYIVMHGGWYMDEKFIKKYGRPGRSWGCPAVPLALYQQIINTIKQKSLLVVYFPSDDWLVKSKFLNCEYNFPAQKISRLLSEAKPVVSENEQRDTILFADLKQNNTFQEVDPVVVMSADNYAKNYHSPAPLGRMLRRQIDNEEYIALSPAEFNSLAMNSADNKEGISQLRFVVPQIIMAHGYYETQFKVVNMGRIKDIQFNPGNANQIQQVYSYVISFDAKPNVNLKSTDRFIRWVGL